MFFLFKKPFQKNGTLCNATGVFPTQTYVKVFCIEGGIGKTSALDHLKPEWIDHPGSELSAC